MAYTDEEAGIAVFPRLHEFLPQIHQELLEGHKGPYRPYRTRTVEVGICTGSSFRRTQEMNG